MIAIARAALLGSLVTVVAAQAVDLYIPEYGNKNIVAQSVGENAAATTYLVACGPPVYTTVSCMYRTAPGRDEGPPSCDGLNSYNVYNVNSCYLSAGATVLQGPSTIVFIKAGYDSETWYCSANGRVSAVCTKNYHTNAYTMTVTGSDFAFVPVPLTTGLVASGPLPTATIQAAQASTTSIAPSTSTKIISSSSRFTPIATIGTSTTPSTSTITSDTSSVKQQSESSSAQSSSLGAGSVSSIGGNNTVSSRTTISAATGISSTASSTPTVFETSDGVPALGWWNMGLAVMTVLAGVAMF